MDRPRRKRMVQRQHFSHEFSVQFNDHNIKQSEVVDTNQSYVAFLNKFVFEEANKYAVESNDTSTWIDPWENLSMNACDDEVFSSTVCESETTDGRTSRISSLRLMRKLFRRPSFGSTNRHSKRSDYGSMASSTPSFNRESAIPEEDICLTTSSDFSMDSGCNFKSSVRTGSSDSEMEFLRYFTFDFYDGKKLLSEVLLAVTDCESSFPSMPDSTAVQIGSKSEVKTLLEGIFEVSAEEIDEIISAMNIKKVVKMNLNLRVLEAKIQRPKYLIGGGNFFATINIQNTNQKFKTRRERGTLNPKWNQDFLLDPNNWCNDILNLEVWHVFESHNIQRVFHKGKKEKLIGSLQVPIKNFKENGVEDWFPLTRTKVTAVEGPPSIIRIQCEARIADDHGRYRNRHSYGALLARVVYSHLKIRSDVEGFQPALYPRWCGNLSPIAQSTMKQYSVFLGLKDPEVHLAWWLICSTVPSVDYDYLFELLLNVQSHLGRKSYNETDIEQLTSSFCNWIKLAINELQRLRINFNPFLRILINLQSQPASNELLKSSDIMLNLISQVECSMTYYVKQWWSNIVGNKLRGVIKPENQLKAVVEITSETVSFLEQLAKHYDGPATLREADPPYFQNMFTMLTHNLKQCACPPLAITCKKLILSKENNPFLLNDGINDNEDFASLLGHLWMKLYEEMGSLHRMSLAFPLKVQRESGIFEYHNWFRGAVQNWMNLLNQRSLPLIDIAVERDTFDQIDEFCNFSSSAVDVLDIMLAAKKWWINLNWPEPESSLVILPKTLEIICSFKTTYVDLLMNKVKIMFNEDPDSNFTCYKRVCTVLNNIERIRNELLQMFEAHVTMERNFLSQADGKESTATFINFSRLIIENSIENIKFESNELIEIVVEKIGDSLQRTALVEASEMHETFMVEFLNPLFKVIHATMNDKNFQWLLRRFWEVLVGLLTTMVAENTNKQATFCKEIDLITEEMLCFVSPAEGVGLPKNVSLSKDYLVLKKQLKYLKMSSESLISEYFSERFGEQDQRNIPCTANLVVRTCIPSPGKLTIEIIMANDMEFNPVKGCLPFVSRHKEYADSYVTADLVPSSLFSGVQNVQTMIQWNSDPAVFNEKFNLEIEEPIDRRHEEGFILFSLRAMHRRRSSIFIGEAVIPLKTHNDKAQNIFLKLTKPGTDDDYQSLPVLKQRISDSIATSFLKERSSLSYRRISLNLFKSIV